MEQSEKDEETLAGEFRNLGKNLVDVLRATWENPERHRLQQEVETGLSELSATLRQEVNSFSDSPTGQRLKADIEDIRQRIRTGEVETRARQELLSVLRAANDELQKAVQNLTKERAETPHQEPPVEHTETEE